MRKTNNKRIFPKEDPLFGHNFVIKGIQVETIDREFSEMMSIELHKDNKEVIFQVGKNIQEWRKNKQKISDFVCNDFNRHLITPWKDVVALEVKYVLMPGKYIL